MVKPRRNPKTKQVESFDRMLRRFKECRDRKYYVKPNDLKNQKNQAIKRRKKLDRMKSEQKGYRSVR